MPKLVLASTNRGKLQELHALLQAVDIELVTPFELGLSLEIKEEGRSYADNAAHKARAFAHATGLLALGDDSGLEVEALNGAPGLYSARFVPKVSATDADRRAYLLKQLHRYPRPWHARFRCSVALATPSGKIRFAEGECAGEIILEERGENGFGYDPIFLIPELGQTMAELSIEAKNHLSHRARAIKAALPLLQDLIAEM